jgi:hypothetical protein
LSDAVPKEEVNGHFNMVELPKIDEGFTREPIDIPFVFVDVNRMPEKVWDSLFEKIKENTLV